MVDAGVLIIKASGNSSGTLCNSDKLGRSFRGRRFAPLQQVVGRFAPRRGCSRSAGSLSRQMVA